MTEIVRFLGISCSLFEGVHLANRLLPLHWTLAMSVGMAAGYATITLITRDRPYGPWWRFALIFGIGGTVGWFLFD